MACCGQAEEAAVCAREKIVVRVSLSAGCTVTSVTRRNNSDKIVLEGCNGAERARPSRHNGVLQHVSLRTHLLLQAEEIHVRVFGTASANQWASRRLCVRDDAGGRDQSTRYAPSRQPSLAQAKEKFGVDVGFRCGGFFGANTSFALVRRRRWIEGGGRGVGEMLGGSRDSRTALLPKLTRAGLPRAWRGLAYFPCLGGSWGLRM